MDVEQVDRDAALPIMLWLYCDHGADQERVFAEQMREGDNDDHLVVQAFARHRSTAQAEAFERAAKIALEYPLTDVAEAHSNAAVCNNAAQNIAAAIRQLAEEAKG